MGHSFKIEPAAVQLGGKDTCCVLLGRSFRKPKTPVALAPLESSAPAFVRDTTALQVHL